MKQLFFSSGFSADSNGHWGVREASEPPSSPTLSREPAVPRPLQAYGGLGDHGHPHGRPQQQPQVRLTVQVNIKYIEENNSLRLDSLYFLDFTMTP